MNLTFDCVTSQLSGLVASLYSQLRVAYAVGLPSDGEGQTEGEQRASDAVRPGR